MMIRRIPMSISKFLTSQLETHPHSPDLEARAMLELPNLEFFRTDQHGVTVFVYIYPDIDGHHVTFFDQMIG